MTADNQHLRSLRLETEEPMTTENQHLRALRADYDRQAGRSLALPLAGAIVWAAVGIAGLFLPARAATLVLLFASGAMFPLALGLARPLGERLLDNTNPLARLMAFCVLMVNLLWALHLTLWFGDPAYVPLSLGIGLGLHWIVFSWVIGHPLGIVHTILRTILATAAWWLVPNYQLSAVAAAVVLAYGYSIYALATRRLNVE